MPCYLCWQRNAPLCWKSCTKVWFINGQQVFVIENFVEGFDQTGLTLGYDGPSVVDNGGWFAAALGRVQRRW